MARWPAGAQERLQEAAIDLFAEDGYERVTVAQIAAGAGLTERTFYNHFSDKREVLFPGQEQYVAGLRGAIAEAAPTDSPLDAVASALARDTEWFDERRAAGVTRRRVIDAHRDLRERERTKMSAIVDAAAEALVGRGIERVDAVLTASAAVAAYEEGTRAWIADETAADLRHHLHASLQRLRTIARGW